MASQAIPVYESVVEWGTNGTSWTVIPEVRGIVVPETSVEYQDVSSLDSDGYREQLATLKDGGDVSFECVYRPATYQLAQGYMNNDTVIHFRVTLPPDVAQSAGDVHRWTAFVRPTVPAGAIEGVVMLMINMRVTGEVTYTRGAALPPPD